MSNTPQTEPISDFMERHFAHLRDGRKEYTEAEVRSIMLAFEAELRRLDTAHTVAVELAAKYAAERDQLRAQVERLQATEPFGYFRVDALGWTDCAATDEGAIALYERPAAPAMPQGWKPVPVESTEEIEAAFFSELSSACCSFFDEDGFSQAWRNAVNAANQTAKATP